MKEQAQLREEMAYQYKLGNFEVKIETVICHYSELAIILCQIC